MKTLIWKEWREQRLFFFLAIGIIILTRVVPYFLPEKMMDHEAYAKFAWVSVFVFSILFSLLLGATSFISEFTKNTKSFLLSQPLTSQRLFWTKFFSGLILLFVLLLITQFVFIALPFKETVLNIHLTRGNWVTLLLFPLSMVLLYFAACFSSLLFKNNLPAIICTPFILIFGVLPILPLLIVLLLMSSSSAVFNALLFSVLIAVFLISNFLIWQKAIVKNVSSAKTIFSTAIIILLISFAVHTITNFAVTRELSKTIQQAKAEGIKLTIQEIIPPPVPDKDNAALVYQQAFALAEKLEATYKIKGFYFPWGAQWGAQLERLDSEQQKAKVVITKIVKDPEFARLYALIKKAVNLPSCRFDLQYERGPAMSLIHITKMRKQAKLIASHTYILTREGRYKEALESAKTGLRLGDSLVDEPILLSQLVRMEADNIAVESFRPLLNNSNGAISINDCRDLISEINKKDNLAKKWLGEEALSDGLYYFRLCLGEIHADFQGMDFGNGKKVTDFADFMTYKTGNFPRFWWKVYGSYLERPIFKGDYIFYIQSFSTLMKLSQKPYFSVKSAISEREREFPYYAGFKRMKYSISSETLPALGRAFTQQAKYTASLDSFKLALALKIYKQKHGHYPDRLASLSTEVIPALPLDPFIGKDYIYRKEGRGFILYSIGPNEKDDNGIYDPKQSYKYDDIVWKVLN